MVHVAVIGCGGYAFGLTEKFWALPNLYEVVAVTSNPARDRPGADVCRKKGIPVYGSVAELLANIEGKCDVIMVPTPIHTHSPITKQCIDAGFDVFLEKPPVATVQEFDDLIRYVKKSDKTVPVCFQCLYGSAIQTVKSYLRQGRLGNVKRIRALSTWIRRDSYYQRASWAGKIKLNGAWILDGTINNPIAHILANELYLASGGGSLMAMPATVQAELYHAHDIEGEDTSSVRVITEDGVEVILNATLCAEEIIWVNTIVETDKATIEYTDFGKAVIKYHDGRTEPIDENCDERIHMLEHLAHWRDDNQLFAATLEVCRPFTLTIDCAFDSSGTIHAVDEKYIRKYEADESIGTDITGINDIMKEAHQQGKLLSELAVPWAVKTKPFQAKGYKEFPARFGCK